MKLNDKWIAKHKPCKKATDWVRANIASIDAEYIITRLLETDHFDWANWAVVRCLTKSKKIRYAIHAAELVIEIYEKECTTDQRPRNAIKEAKKYLRGKSTREKCRNAAADACDAASDAYDAAYAALAADAASYALYSAYAALAATAAATAAATLYAACGAALYDTTSAAAYADACAAHATASNKKDIKIKCIQFGLKLMKEKK